MYHPGYRYYYTYNGKQKDKSKLPYIYPSFVPLAHCFTNDSFVERGKGMPKSIESVGTLMRWKNREQSPTFIDELIEYVIPTDFFFLGTKPT